jgi:hypothetical protein
MFNVSVYAFNTKKAFKKACRYCDVSDTLSKDAYGYASHICHDNGTSSVYIGSFSNDTGVAVHEMVHAADMIMEYHEITDQEVRAYMVQHFHDVFFEYLTKEKKRKKC